MTNVILPIAYWLLSIGDTINMRNYVRSGKVLYNQSEIVKTPVNTLNSTYYILQSKDYPTFGIPIDMARNQTRSIDWFLGLEHWIGYNGYDTAAELLIVMEYVMSESTLKNGAKPRDCWQNKGDIAFDQTHYVDKMQHGGRLITMFRFQSNVTGDVQILRRLLTDIMGKSGNVDENIVDLYQKALKAMRESEDVRGKTIHVDYNFVSHYVDVPHDSDQDREAFLKNLNNLTKNARINSTSGRYIKPLYVSYKPLHDLDKRFSSLEKNVVSEQYLVKLYKIIKDLDEVVKYINSQCSIPGQVRAFQQKVRSVREDAGKLLEKEMSIFKDIDVSAFENFFQEYENGLNNSTESYLIEYQTLREKITVSHEDSFLMPTRGSLLVEENEFEEKGNTESLSECQDLCLEEERCRAVGYDESNKHCVLYYRSTYSARIHFPEESSSEFKVYDRSHELLYYNDCLNNLIYCPDDENINT